MRNYEIAMMTYARLARISHETPNPLGRDRFLALTGREACLAGWLDVAGRCRELVLAMNPHHFLSQTDSFPDALRDSANAGYFERFNSFCSFEQAEHLLSENGDPSFSTERDAGENALLDLSTIVEP